MDAYSLNGASYLHPTPAGALLAASADARDRSATFLRRLLRETRSPALSVSLLQSWTGLAEQPSLEVLLHLQQAGLVQGLAEAVEVLQGAMGSVVPALLAPLSGEGRALLVDGAGLPLASVGFAPQAVEELAAWAAELHAVQARHAAMLDRHLRLGGHAWGVVAAAGFSELACWPLQVAERPCLLVVAGEPRLNQPALTSLVWYLGAHHAG